ncbi:MAG: tRNA (guanine37-N1)-methyltransferase [Synergistales bacterium]|nr:tRNA (guanine37-N1)-methyltransferase [Synergistales bacterium]
MKFSVISAFPEYFETFFNASIIGKAVRRSLISYELLNPRDFAEGPHRQIDDYAYGGGGMVMMAEPLARAVDVAGKSDAKVILMSPQGRKMDQGLVEELSVCDHIILVCGHYEGIDERFVESFVDMEVSLGDFVLTGGEIPAMALMDALSRRVPGVVGKDEAVREDSFFRGMLDTPHYTRPPEWRGKKVPEVLLSGNHGAVETWRRKEAVRRTLERRPDIVEDADVRPYLQKNVCVLLYLEPFEKTGYGAGLTEIARDTRVMGCNKLFLASAEDGGKTAAEQVKKLKEILPGICAPSFLKSVKGIEEAAEWVRRKEKLEPIVIDVGFFSKDRVTDLKRVKRKVLEDERPVIFTFGRPNDGSEAAHQEKGPCKKEEQREFLSLHGSLTVVLERFFGFCRC